MRGAIASRPAALVAGLAVAQASAPGGLRAREPPVQRASISGMHECARRGAAARSRTGSRADVAGQARHGHQSLRCREGQPGARDRGRTRRRGIAQFLYGFQFYQQNEMPAAIAALEKARELNPRDARAGAVSGAGVRVAGPDRRGAAAVPARGPTGGRRRASRTSRRCSRCRGCCCCSGDFDECGRVIERAAQGRPEIARSAFRSGTAAAEKRRARQGGAGRRNGAAADLGRYYGPAGPFSACAGVPRVGARCRRRAARRRGARGD